jgi:hypothetical protein
MYAMGLLELKLVSNIQEYTYYINYSINYSSTNLKIINHVSITLHDPYPGF